MEKSDRRVHGAERLRVYHLALDLGEQIDGMRELMGSGSLADQVRRASESVVLNIAEGAAHYSPRRKAYHYRLAHGSAAEVIAGLTRLHRRYPSPSIATARRTANMICIMLSPLIRTVSTRPHNDTP